MMCADNINQASTTPAFYAFHDSKKESSLRTINQLSFSTPKVMFLELMHTNWFKSNTSHLQTKEKQIALAFPQQYNHTEIISLDFATITLDDPHEANEWLHDSRMD